MTEKKSNHEIAEPHVGLFATCLVDSFRPRVGFAAAALLEKSGCRVSVPAAQTCCGQPAYNSGDRKNAVAIARQVIENFESFDYTVAPSGSCAAMIKCHFPGLFEEGSDWRRRADRLAARTFELVSFLVDCRGVGDLDIGSKGAVAYHDSCSGLRELGIYDQPRRLLGAASGLSLRAVADSETCCGFGGTFCVKYPDISNRMVTDKASAIVATGADLVLAGDMGCLLNIAGKLKRDGSPVKVRHIAEVLAGMDDAPAIGEGD